MALSASTVNHDNSILDMKNYSLSVTLLVTIIGRAVQNSVVWVCRDSGKLAIGFVHVGLHFIILIFGLGFGSYKNQNTAQFKASFHFGGRSKPGNKKLLRALCRESAGTAQLYAICPQPLAVHHPLVPFHSTPFSHFVIVSESSVWLSKILTIQLGR